MVEKLDKQTKHESEPTGQTIERLSAAVQMPWYGSDNILYIGWTIDSKPAMSYDQVQLSPQALESYKITKAVDFPLPREDARLPIVPIEFVATSTPIDLKDKSDKKTEDILVYGVSDQNGQISFMKIEELDIMEAILKGTVVWEDINTKTVFKDETIPSLSMYNLIFQAKTEKGDDVLYIMLFKPAMDNESNEFMYQQFLVQTIKSLVTLDSKQIPKGKKGYEQAVQQQLVNQDITGSDAYIVMNALKELGIVDVPEEKLEELRRESSGKSFRYQLMLLAREAGLIKMSTPESRGAKDQIETFTTDELMGILKLAYRIVSRSFNEEERNAPRRSSNFYR
ncbi:hypothetical protein A2154_03955 [Candidatus Gottesmanbacteria bacterium RBG_16_43_7]|uniref:Uncharacterized protein n=1 Tax=Candidatus Gottesmanbacteria bacterium RBG_16_43_7 TaxID=1798373 RepID=A0A1F5Z8I0_9BACT|nr:MAG: hypothetical protein A2154_03955 [Candidatus Gottesmanbacteria bacterium RBG_16_43_7]